MTYMWHSSLFWLCSCFLPVFSSGTIPRLTLRQDSLGHELQYIRNLSHTVFFYQDGSDNLYIGGSNYVLQVDVNDGHILENFTLSDNKDLCNESYCENAVTVIEEFQDCLFVCGTNGERPKCWKLYPRKNNRSSEVVKSLDGIGISPYIYSQNSLSLTVDEDLYAAAPLYKEGTSLQFRRKAGRRNNVWMYDQWVTEPTFISAFLASRPDDALNEKIYILFREKNLDNSPEADPWISRVARVCKVDEGGPKSFFQNIWTSFLKARLVCAIPAESVYFNRLQDIFVLHSENWRNTQVYALFSSGWNSTALCIYSLDELDYIFENSTFKDYKEKVPNPRPGTCVSNSRLLETSTINVIKHNSEMTDWVQPIQKHTPFYISSNNYTKIVVDRVQATDGEMHNVILLATDNGKIHKILEDGYKPFIISETSLCNGSTPVLSLKLNSEKRKLYVGYPGQMSILDLQRCQDYNNSCEDCVLARDPYCAWTESGCTSQIKQGIQNIAIGETHVCTKNSDLKVRRKKRDTFLLRVPLIEHTVPQGLTLYFSCPIESHHATYNWNHKNTSSPCQLTQSDCLHLIPSVSTDDYGIYICVSNERDYTKVIKRYSLHHPPDKRILSSGIKMTMTIKWIWAVFATVLLTVNQLL